MAGQSYSEMKQGDRCWLIVDSVNRPTGIWKGEVLTVKERDGGWEGPWFEVTAKITDGRVKDHPELVTRGFFGHHPGGHYRVVPSNKEFDWLVKRIAVLEAKLQQMGSSAADREELLLTALERVTRGTLTVDVARVAVLGD